MRFTYASNKELVDALILEGTLKTKEIIEAFYKIDRALFVLDELKDQSYGDYPLSIGYNQTISQPTTVAIMLELLGPKNGDKILDIGAGSGYSTALLSTISKDGYVIGLERIKELVEFGNNNLKKASIKNAKIELASNKLGLPGELFDKILVSASAKTFPKSLISQLKIGGSVVIPINNSIIKATKISETQINATELYGFVFVPLIYDE